MEESPSYLSYFHIKVSSSVAFTFDFSSEKYKKSSAHDFLTYDHSADKLAREETVNGYPAHGN